MSWLASLVVAVVAGVIGCYLLLRAAVWLRRREWNRDLEHETEADRA